MGAAVSTSDLVLSEREEEASVLELQNFPPSQRNCTYGKQMT